MPACRDEATLRSEVRRLFRWLKEEGLTAIVTAERGSGALTRHGLEEYVSDCVILLDHRVVENVSTRRLRIVNGKARWWWGPTASSSTPTRASPRWRARCFATCWEPR